MTTITRATVDNAIAHVRPKDPKAAVLIEALAARIESISDNEIFVLPSEFLDAQIKVQGLESEGLW